MRIKFLATVSTALLISSGLLAGAANAQVSSSQFQKDSEIKKPSVADASLARDDAKVAKKSAMTAKKAAMTPKAKAAANKAAEASDAASREAAAAVKQAKAQ